MHAHRPSPAPRARPPAGYRRRQLRGDSCPAAHGRHLCRLAPGCPPARTRKLRPRGPRRRARHRPPPGSRLSCVAHSGTDKQAPRWRRANASRCSVGACACALPRFAATCACTHGSASAFASRRLVSRVLTTLSPHHCPFSLLPVPLPSQTQPFAGGDLSHLAPAAPCPRPPEARPPQPGLPCMASGLLACRARSRCAPAKR